MCALGPCRTHQGHAGPTRAMQDPPGPCRTHQGHAGPTRAMQDPPGPCRTHQGHAGPTRAVQDPPGPCRTHQGHAGPTRAMQDPPGPCRTHQGHAGPTRAVQDPPGPCRTHQGHAGPTRAMQDPPGPCRTHQDHAGPTRAMQDPPGPCRTHQGHAGPTRAMQDPPGPCRTHQGHAGPTRAMQDPPGPCRTHQEMTAAIHEEATVRDLRPKFSFISKEQCEKSPRRAVVRSSAGRPGRHTPPPPLLGGHSRSIPQGMIFDVQPLVKSLFCPTKQSPNGFFDSEASIPLKLAIIFGRGWGGIKGLWLEGFEPGSSIKEGSGADWPIRRSPIRRPGVRPLDH